MIPSQHQRIASRNLSTFPGVSTTRGPKSASREATSPKQEDEGKRNRIAAFSPVSLSYSSLTIQEADVGLGKEQLITLLFFL